MERNNRFYLPRSRKVTNITMITTKENNGESVDKGLQVGMAITRPRDFNNFPANIKVANNPFMSTWEFTQHHVLCFVSQDLSQTNKNLIPYVGSNLQGFNRSINRSWYMCNCSSLLEKARR